MPPLIDFDWQEGEPTFDAAEERPYGPAAFPSFERHPAPALYPRSGVDDVDPPRQTGAGWWRGLSNANNAVLLLIGVILGLGLGFFFLTYQGQYKARADLTPVLQLQHQALSSGDRDLYGSLIDVQDPIWRQHWLESLAHVGLLYDFESGAPSVKRVHVQGDYAEVESEYRYEGMPYRTLQVMRLVNGQWRLTKARFGPWGQMQSVEGQYVTLHYRERDAFLSQYLPHIDSLAETYCERYQPAPPCQIDLRIDSDPELLPFRPGSGAHPLPITVHYRIIGVGNTPLVTVNGMGEETHDPAFQRLLLELLPDVTNINFLYPAITVYQPNQAGAQMSARELLYGRSMPVTVISPRLVGLNRERPHPLWWLALHEAMGEAVMRRAVGTVTAPETGAYSIWAIARGDVALRAERLSGVRLPDPSLPEWTDIPAIGAAIAQDGVSQRNAARSLVLYLQTRYEAESLLAFLRQAREAHDIEALFAPLAANPRLLSEEWREWLSQRQD